MEYVEYLHTLFDGLNRGICNLYEMESLIYLLSTYVVKPIGFTVIDLSFVLMEVKEKLIVESLEIELTLLQNPENLLNMVCI